MKLWWATFAALVSVGAAQLTTDPVKLKNWCLEARHHKVEPGPEDELHAQCTPWKNRACCTSATTFEIHKNSMYNFEYNHCPGNPLSDKCLKHFTQNHCFFECSPNLGPWVVNINMKTRNETFHGVPLCAPDCDAWFNDCKVDYTCALNWLKDFDWKNGKNVCRQNNPCKRIKDMYKNAAHFCENVWDQSWTYTQSNKACMRLWFNATNGNPNDKVAELRIAELLSASAHNHAGSIAFVSLVITLFLN